MSAESRSVQSNQRENGVQVNDVIAPGIPVHPGGMIERELYFPADRRAAISHPDTIDIDPHSRLNGKTFSPVDVGSEYFDRCLPRCGQFLAEAMHGIDRSPVNKGRMVGADHMENSYLPATRNHTVR